MEDKIRKIMDESTDYQTGEVDAEIAISKLLDLFSVNTRDLEEKGLTYAYELAKETHLNEDGILTVNADVLQMVAKDYVKHVSHFLNVC